MKRQSTSWTNYLRALVPRRSNGLPERGYFLMVDLERESPGGIEM